MQARTKKYLWAIPLCIAAMIPFGARASGSCNAPLKLVASMRFDGAMVTVGAAYVEPGNARKAVIGFLKCDRSFTPNDDKPPPSVGLSLVFTGSSRVQDLSSNPYGYAYGHGYAVTKVPVTAEFRQRVGNMSQRIDIAPVVVYVGHSHIFKIDAYEKVNKNNRWYDTVKISRGSCVWTKIYHDLTVVGAGFFQYQGRQYVTVVSYAHVAGLAPYFRTYEFPAK